MQNFDDDLAPFELPAPEKTPRLAHEKPIEPEVKRLPHNTEAENSIIGAVLIDPRIIDRISAIVKPSDFYHELNRLSFEILLDMVDREIDLDPITLAEQWSNAGHDLAKVQNGALFTQWANEVVGVSMAPSWAKIVADKSRLRGLVEIGVQISELAINGQASAEAIERAESLVLNERANAPQAETVYKIGLAAIAKDPERSQIALRPFKKHVSEFTGPVCSTDLVILAGRPATGKTAKSIEILLRLAMEGIPVLFLSLEMSRDQIFYRLVAMITGVSIPRDERQRDQVHEDAMIEASVMMRKMPFFIDDDPDLSPRSLRWKIRRYRKQHGIKFVVLDYLQLLTGDSSRETQFDTVTNASKACKAAAKENKIGFIALSQMNREIEKTNRRPKVSDLRSSGQIEQDADLIIFLHAPGAPEQRGTDWIVETICPKNRHGSTGEVAEVFNPSRMSFKLAEFSDKARLGYDIPGETTAPYGNRRSNGR